jgi:hypothetical protein
LHQNILNLLMEDFEKLSLSDAMHALQAFRMMGKDKVA